MSNDELERKQANYVHAVRNLVENRKTALEILVNAWETKYVTSEPDYHYEISEQVLKADDYQYSKNKKDSERAVAIRIKQRKKGLRNYLSKKIDYAVLVMVFDMYDMSKPKKYYIKYGDDAAFQLINCHFTLDSEIQWQLEKVKYIALHL